MAGITALRSAARDALLSAGGRGFVRFLAQGDALLVSDAVRRCADEADIVRLRLALEAAGFSCRTENGLLLITPGDALLLSLCARPIGHTAVDWDSPLFETAALSSRLLACAPLPLDEGGRALLMDALRLLWQPQDKVLPLLPALRGQIAVHLRSQSRSGLHETGRLLALWLDETTHKEDLP